MNGFSGPGVAILLCTATVLWLALRGASSARAKPTLEEAPARSDRLSLAAQAALILFVLWLITDLIAISMLGGPKQPTFRTVGGKDEPSSATPRHDVRPEGQGGAIP